MRTLLYIGDVALDGPPRSRGPGLPTRKSELRHNWWGDPSGVCSVSIRDLRRPTGSEWSEPQSSATVHPRRRPTTSPSRSPGAGTKVDAEHERRHPGRLVDRPASERGAGAGMGPSPRSSRAMFRKASQLNMAVALVMHNLDRKLAQYAGISVRAVRGRPDRGAPQGAAVFGLEAALQVSVAAGCRGISDPRCLNMRPEATRHRISLDGAAGRSSVSVGHLVRWTSLGALTVAGATAGALLLDRGRSETGNSPPPPASVSAATVSSGDVSIELEGLGRVQAHNTVTVRTLVGGQVRSIDFADGRRRAGGAAGHAQARATVKRLVRRGIPRWHQHDLRLAGK